MKGMFYMKKIYTIILSMCFILLCSTTSFASTINEIEPNNSANEAQTIYRNNENPAQIVNGDYSGQYVTVGTLTDSTDKDWYKVYLPADRNTILGINSTALNGTGTFSIYNENLNLISQISHQKDPSIIGTTPYYINIPTAGYYYVEVSSTLNGGSYRFHIGGPDYTVDNYTYTAPSAVTLTPTISSVQATYNLSNIASIPDNAIVYYVSFINYTPLNKYEGS